MSLVAYGSSDESSDEEIVTNEDSTKQLNNTKSIIENNIEISKIIDIPIKDETLQETKIQTTITIDNIPKAEKSLTNENRNRINLPIPKIVQEKDLNVNKNIVNDIHNNGTINFNLLPQPKHKDIVETTIEDDDDDCLPPSKLLLEKPEKKEKGPVKISVPSLSDVSYQLLIIKHYLLYLHSFKNLYYSLKISTRKKKRNPELNHHK